MRILLKSGHLFDPAINLDKQADLLIEDEIIKAIEDDIAIEDDMVVYDVSGEVVCPGFIDMHVHLREPGFEYKEDIEHGAKAAAAGGFTTICCMPNTNPICDNRSVLEFIKSQATQANAAEVLPYASITKAQDGSELTEMAELVKNGAVGFSDDGRPVANAEVMRNALDYSSIYEVPIIDHLEEKSLTEGRVMHHGAVSTKLGLRGIPAVAEEVMAYRDIQLAELVDGRLHLCHLSSKGTVELLRQAKQRNLKVSGEVTVHHLLLTDKIVADLLYDTNTKVNPPLRTEEDRQALIQGLKDGTIDAIVTDHAPHHIDDKLMEYDAAAFGITGLDIAIPLLLDQLVKPGHVSLKEMVLALTQGPAKALNRKAVSLEVGQVANISILDLNMSQVVDPETFQSKGKNTPFTGYRLTGWPTKTIVRGKIVFKRK